jgi:TRAP-type C4-dicarboxylate transport system permease small subunit
MAISPLKSHGARAMAKVSVTYDTLKRLNRICVSLASLLVLFISFSVFVDVILRYFFNRPSTWVTEISGYLFMYIIFLGTSFALQEGFHIRVDFVLYQFKDPAKRIINLITSIFSMGFCIVLLWGSSLMTWSAFKRHWVSPTLLCVPYVYIYIGMVFGSLMLFLTFLCQTVLEFKRDKTSEPEQ